jgi:hypothetical protein
MDWASILPGAITGVVGLAGIGGALWEGKRTREAASRSLQSSLDAAAENLASSAKAEDMRAYDAEKRRIYAAFNGAIERIWFVATSSQDFTTDPGRSNYNNAMTALWSAYYEVSLIAPSAIERSASALTNALKDFGAARLHDREADQPRGFDNKRKRLVDDMRTNLEEHGPLREEAASTVGKRLVPDVSAEAGRDRETS